MSIKNLSDTVATANTGRDPKGRFSKGNTFAKANPYAKRVAQLRKVILNTVTDEAVSELIKGMIDKATECRDVAAAKLVLLYSVGQPQVFESPDIKYPEFMNSIFTDKMQTAVYDLISDLKYKKGMPIEDIIPIVGEKYSAVLSDTDN